MTASYSISSYGGIGDENPSEASEKKLTHNLSGSCHELTITIKERTIKLLIDMG